MTTSADGPARASDDPNTRPAEGTERVEQRIEEWGRRVGRFLASAAASAREEAEDILAEAQSIRRGERE
jgi:hypothetical protein